MEKSKYVTRLDDNKTIRVNAIPNTERSFCISWFDAEFINDLSQAIINNQVGFYISVKHQKNGDHKLIMKPTSKNGNFTLTFESEDVAKEIYMELTAQALEIEELALKNSNKKKTLIDKMTEAELYESLINSVRKNIQHEGAASITFNGEEIKAVDEKGIDEMKKAWIKDERKKSLNRSNEEIRKGDALTDIIREI